MSGEQLRARLIEEADRLLEDTLWSEKQHFAMATIWRRFHLWLGIPSALLAGAASVSALQSYPILAAALAAGSAVITALMAFLSPEESGSRHYKTGVGYSALRGKLRRFRNLDSETAEFVDNGRSRVDALADEKRSLMEGAPHIGGLAYWLARRSIGRQEHVNAVDQRN